MIYIVMALIAGVTVTSARLINANLGSKIGMFQSTVYNYVVGLTVSTVFWLISREGFSLARLESVPIWAYCGGLVGIVIVTVSSIVAQKISAFYLTITIFCGQLFTGILIDYFVSSAFSIGKLIGGLLVILGLLYNLYVDKKVQNAI
ncbi:MAG: DMT family transporter [Cellulosilyticaceae bacterium]